MRPVLFEVGGWTLYAWGALAALGFMATSAVAMREARRRGLPANGVAEALFAGVVTGLVGARGLHIALSGPPATWGELLSPRGGGAVFFGGAVAALIAGSLVAWRRRIAWLDLADAIALGAPLGHGIARVGCFLAGCCYGLPLQGPLGLATHDRRSASPLHVELLPIQLVEAGGLFALFGGLWLLRHMPRGRIFAAWLTGYGALRFITELGRGDVRGTLPGTSWSVSQGMALLATLGGAALWVWLGRAGNRPPAGESTAIAPPPPREP